MRSSSPRSSRPRRRPCPAAEQARAVGAAAEFDVPGQSPHRRSQPGGALADQRSVAAGQRPGRLHAGGRGRLHASPVDAVLRPVSGQHQVLEARLVRWKAMLDRAGRGQHVPLSERGVCPPVLRLEPRLALPLVTVGQELPSQRRGDAAGPPPAARACRCRARGTRSRSPRPSRSPPGPPGASARSPAPSHSPPGLRRSRRCFVRGRRRASPPGATGGTSRSRCRVAPCSSRSPSRSRAPSRAHPRAPGATAGTPAFAHRDRRLDHRPEALVALGQLPADGPQRGHRDAEDDLVEVGPTAQTVRLPV